MNAAIKPYAEVAARLGAASEAWEELTGRIRAAYVMDEVWMEGKPTHKYHSDLRFRRGGKTLVTLAVREGYFNACVVLGRDERERFEASRDGFGEVACRVYDDATTYHDGKWLGFEVSDDAPTDDIMRLLAIKRKPNRKAPLPDPANCGTLDLGLAHDEVSRRIGS